jgi:hypothetical protein
MALEPFFRLGIRMNRSCEGGVTVMRRKKKHGFWLAALASSWLIAAPALAKPIAYPAKGQSVQQQQKDDGECYTWAKGATGIDPLNLAATPAPQSQAATGGGERVTGALRGAVVGGIIDGSDGAAKGAGVGLVAGGAKARQNQRSRQAQQSSQQQNQINTFYRAHSACMEGRGYSVK